MIFYGPPGCGKTHRLLDEAAIRIQAGVSIEDIGFMSFTRKAAKEGLSRVGYNGLEAPWWRTIHSTCYKAMNLRRDEVLNEAQLIELGRDVGCEFTGKRDEFGFFAGKGDAEIMNCIHLARNRMEPVEVTAATLEVRAPLWRVKQIAEDIYNWKRERGLFDYTDMLEYCIDHPDLLPELKVLIVDEAQDLTPLQWQVIDAVGQRCDEVIIAGDDDQGIYYWAGADVERLLKHDDESIILDKSHRVPKKVQELADRIVTGIQHRVEKEWKPRDEDVSV